MKTQTGLTIETKGNVINVYTDEDIKRGKIVQDKRDTLKQSIIIAVTMTLVVTYYLLAFKVI